MFLAEYDVDEAIEIAEYNAAKNTEFTTNLKNIKSLMETLNLSTEQAMDALKIDSEARGKFIVALK